ncbi:TolC family protein [Nannocystis pusilla]|uniref:TolC family protein n=1 Tax=Nannocystis pusilla TaxID=889268 RepID=UPI003B78386A
MPLARSLCLVLALLAGPVRAAPAESALSGPFDIDTAVAVALERSPGLQAAAHRIRAAEHLAEAERRPEATRLTFDIWQVPLNRPWAWNESPMVMLGLRQPVPAAGSLKLRSAARRKDAAADAANRDVVAQDLATAVRHAFIDYAAAIARHSVHLEHQRVSEHVLGLARAPGGRRHAPRDRPRRDRGGPRAPTWPPTRPRPRPRAPASTRSWPARPTPRSVRRGTLRPRPSTSAPAASSPTPSASAPRPGPPTPAARPPRSTCGPPSARPTCRARCSASPTSPPPSRCRCTATA